MKKVALWTLTTVALMLIWAVGNYLSTTQGWFLKPLAKPSDHAGFMLALEKKVNEQYKGNLTLLMVEAGEVAGNLNVSKGKPVTSHSVFGVSSVSKWVTAAGVMKLVEQGLLDLDVPVSNYLTRWQLPDSQYDNDKVTVRRLLSHTAGLTDGLGHNGFPVGQPVQSLIEHLTQAKDAEENVSGRVEVGLPPGEQWKYSGGSYNLLQLLVEEVSQTSFATYMQKHIFEPAGMTDTSFILNRQDPNLAQYFDNKAQIKEYPNYTSLAATGLYTTASDLHKFLVTQLPSNINNKQEQKLLSDASLATIAQLHASVSGMPIWGAGAMLYAENDAGGYIIGHGGRSPSLNASVRVNPATGDGIIVLQTGNEEALASDLTTYWTVWKTGRPDIFMLKNQIPDMLGTVVLGGLFILFVSISTAVFRYRKAKKLAAQTS